jgi:hypothetical protein
LVGPAQLSVEEKNATVALVRELEHELFAAGSGEGGQPSEAALGYLNLLRTTLGWLEVDSSGQWLWPA